MRHRPLGRTALQVSELCLGTMNFGPNTSEADSFELLDRAMQHLDEAVHATTVVLTDQVLARLDEIFPGPGPAPEAYAW